MIVTAATFGSIIKYLFDLSQHWESLVLLHEYILLSITLCSEPGIPKKCQLMNSFWARYACVTPAPFFVCGFLAMIYENIKDKLLKAKNGPQNWS
jgi:hypothetical protein